MTDYSYEDAANLCICCGFVTDYDLCNACDAAGCSLEVMMCDGREHDDW